MNVCAFDAAVRATDDGTTNGCGCCGFFFFIDRTMVENFTLNSLSELYYAGLYAHDMSEKMAVLFELQKNDDFAWTQFSIQNVGILSDQRKELNTKKAANVGDSAST